MRLHARTSAFDLLKSSMLGRKGADLFKEHVETGISFERDMVVARQLDELGAGDQAGSQAAFADWNLVVAGNMEDQIRPR